jgi:hypothetical protein
MGGKGGGGSSNQQVEDVMVGVHGDVYRQKIAEEKAADPAAWKAKYGPGGSAHDFYMKVHPDGAADFDDPKPVELAAPEPEPVVEEPAPVAPPVQQGPPVVPDAPLAPPNSLPVPGAGDVLGGAVTKPPKYWTGGLDAFEAAPRTGRGNSEGAIRTTQT